MQSGRAQILNLTALSQRWEIYTPGQLRQRIREANSDTSLIAGLIPKRSISLVVGDSGIGKSPLLYQAALCVAAGLPFLGSACSQGRVLYMDFENGLGQVDDLIRQLCIHLGLSEPPANLLLWNYNDCSPNWTAANLAAMVTDAQVDLVIIDSLSAYAPDMEEKAANVTREYQNFRRIIRDTGAAIVPVHHRKKPSSNEVISPSLEENPHAWLLQARGSGALVNSSDVRIGIDRRSVCVII